jgi:hypothetical protein
VRVITLRSSLNAIRFHERAGYERGAASTLRIGEGVTLDCVDMHKAFNTSRETHTVDFDLKRRVAAQPVETRQHAARKQCESQEQAPHSRTVPSILPFRMMWPSMAAGDPCCDLVRPGRWWSRPPNL